MNLFGLFAITSFAILNLGVVQLKVTFGNEGPGEICEMEDGVRGRCEETSECKRNGGVVRRNGAVKFCGTSDDRKVYVCCRRPIEITKELCKSWDRYWNKAKIKCLYDARESSGGKPANPGEYPEVGILGVRERKKIQWVCGATLLTPHFALTAAHCVILKKSYVIRLGDHDLYVRENQTIPRLIGPVPKIYGEGDLLSEHLDSSAPVEQLVNVADIIIHPDYDDFHYNDIALLMFSKPVVFTERVLPACLATPVDEENPNHQRSIRGLTVAGWGTSGFHEVRLSPSMLKVDIPLIPNSECSRLIEMFSTHYIPKGLMSTQMCAGSPGRNACRGDSGGPLLSRGWKKRGGANCEHIIIGIVSYGHGCGRVSVYSRVSAYLDWITGHIAPKLVPGN